MSFGKLQEQLLLLPQLLGAHLELALWSLLVGAALSIPLGIALARRPRLQRAALSLASTVQTIPSLALLAVMVPLLALLTPWGAAVGLHLRSIGYLPALLALTAYSILPMLRGTLSGLQGVDPAQVQAARAVGMTPWQCLWRVELPQALPIIAGGVRTAMVWVVGMTVLSTPVGAPSLGNYIFSGLQTANHAAIAVGCVAAAALALTLDALLHAIEVGLATGKAWRWRVPSALLALLYVGLLGSSVLHRLHAVEPIRIGAKTFTEQYILAEIIAQHLQQHSGRRTEIVSSLGGTMALEGLRDHAIDVYVDYSGSLWKTQVGTPLPTDPQVVIEQLSATLRQHGDVQVVGRMGFANNYALAMRRSVAQADHLVTLDDLAAQAPQRRIAGDYEIFQRDEWRDLQGAYGLHFGEQRSMDPALMVQALMQNEVDVITAYTSDGRIAQLDLQLLEDNRHSLPSYEALLLTGPRLQHDAPIRQALEALRGRISLRCMQRLNFLVDHDHQSPAEAARLFFVGICQSLH